MDSNPERARYIMVSAGLGSDPERTRYIMVSAGLGSDPERTRYIMVSAGLGSDPERTRCGRVAKFETISIELVGAIINRPRALNERPYVHRT